MTKQSSWKEVQKDGLTAIEVFFFQFKLHLTTKLIHFNHYYSLPSFIQNPFNSGHVHALSLAKIQV